MSQSEHSFGSRRERANRKKLGTYARIKRDEDQIAELERSVDTLYVRLNIARIATAEHADKISNITAAIYIIIFGFAIGLLFAANQLMPR